jgi:hypothetical protein
VLSPEVEPGELTDIDRFIFESWGYFVIPGVLRPPEVQECSEASKRLHARAGSAAFAQVGRGYETEPALERLIDHPAVLPKVRGLYGDRFIVQAGWNTTLPIGHVICAAAGSVLVFHNAVWHRTCAHDGDYDRYTTHYIYSPPWVRPSGRLANDGEFLRRTTGLRRSLMGEFERADAPMGSATERPASMERGDH